MSHFLIIAWLIALGALYLILERESGLIEDAIKKDPPQIVFTRPIPCDATLASGIHEHQRAAWLERCYVAKSRQ